MRTYEPSQAANHSDAWIFQVKASFAAAVLGTGTAIAYAPIGPWVRGCIGMGMLLVINSTLPLAKTLRDVHESHRLVNRLDEVKVERMLQEHDPFRIAA